MHFSLEPYISYVLYFVGIVTFFLTVFWRPIIGIFFMLPLIPLQTIRYRMNVFPLGESVVGIMLLAVVLGLLRRGEPVLPRTPWTKLLCAYAMFTLLSLCLGSSYLGRSLPLPGDPRFGVWQEYMAMPALLLLTVAVAPTSRQMRAMVIVICLATLALNHNFWNIVSSRDFSAYSDELREGGIMGYAGTNGLAAFEAQVAVFLFALAGFERRFLLRVGYYALAAFSGVCTIYSLSRGGYVALLVGCLFLGLVKQRKLLFMVVVFVCTWRALVPHAVEQRVLTSYDEQSGSLEHSAATRIELWEDAMEVFRTSPVMGTGFNTYAYMHRVGDYEDTHNFFLKVLVESGVLGLLIFVLLLVKTFGTGYLLFRRAQDPFLASLGLGLAAWVVCSITANCFGDRWTFLQVNGYMWVLAGLVSRAWTLEQNSTSATVEADDAAGASRAMLEAAAGQT